MYSTQLDPSAELLKSYIPPFQGTWKTVPPQLLPDDVVQDSMNVSLLGGRLRARLGLLNQSNFDFNNHILGSFLFTSVANTKHPLASTKSKLFRYDGSWTDITSTTLNGTDASQIRMTSLQQGSSIYVIYTNGVDFPKYAPDATGLIDITPYVDPITGTSSLPILKDLCTSFDRIVGITPPYTITWSDPINDDYLAFTNWPATNQAILSQTEDALVAIRSLGTLGLAIYKEGSLYTGTAQAGPQSQAFRFEYRGEAEGPAGVNAIVKAKNSHIYMTPTGRVGLFDGTRHEWLADGLWPFLQDTLDTAYAYKIHGCYNYRTSEVYFYYPRVGDSGAVKGILILNDAYPLAGVNTVSYFLGSVAFTCTNSLSVPLNNASTSPLVFGQPSMYTDFILDKNTYTDNNIPFSCSFKTGLFKPIIPVPVGAKKDNADVFRPILELYTTRDESRGLVELAAVTSQNLANDGISSVAERVDTSVEPINEYIGFNESGSFLGIEATWMSDAKIEYKGCDVYGRKTL